MRNRSNLQSIFDPVPALPRATPQVEKGGGLTTNPRARMTVEEIAGRLDIGRLAVYTMLEQGLLPGVRLGRRWIVTRAAFESWEKTCGSPMRNPTGTGFRPDFEVTV
jgi:excisionase family DNA binding protein